LTSIAYAMGQSGAGGGSAQGGFTALMPLILMFVIFYFLLIRPQQKKAKELQQMINNLKKDDRVITSGGICGRVTSLDDTKVTVEIADKIRIKVLRGNIAVLDNPSSPSPAEKKGKK
jgi:preprotein translocase subunit YajC